MKPETSRDLLIHRYGLMPMVKGRCFFFVYFIKLAFEAGWSLLMLIERLTKLPFRGFLVMIGTTK